MQVWPGALHCDVREAERRGMLFGSQSVFAHGHNTYMEDQHAHKPTHTSVDIIELRRDRVCTGWKFL